MIIIIFALITNNTISWLSKNMVYVTQIIQTVAIIATVLVMIFQLRGSTKSNRALMSLQFTNSHREIWSHLFTNPTLERIQNDEVDLTKEPLKLTEEFFVIMVLNHMSAVFDAFKQGLHRIYIDDFIAFFKLPIPKEVWALNKQYQNQEFVKFIDNIVTKGQ